MTSQPPEPTFPSYWLACQSQPRIAHCSQLSDPQLRPPPRSLTFNLTSHSSLLTPRPHLNTTRASIASLRASSTVLRDSIATLKQTFAIFKSASVESITSFAHRHTCTQTRTMTDTQHQIQQGDQGMCPIHRCFTFHAICEHLSVCAQQHRNAPAACTRRASVTVASNSSV
jgi:hypothetical protein